MINLLFHYQEWLLYILIVIWVGSAIIQFWTNYNKLKRKNYLPTNYKEIYRVAKAKSYSKSHPGYNTYL